MSKSVAEKLYNTKPRNRSATSRGQDIGNLIAYELIANPISGANGDSVTMTWYRQDDIQRSEIIIEASRVILATFDVSPVTRQGRFISSKVRDSIVAKYESEIEKLTATNDVTAEEMQAAIDKKVSDSWKAHAEAQAKARLDAARARAATEAEAYAAAQAKAQGDAAAKAYAEARARAALEAQTKAKAKAYAEAQAKAAAKAYAEAQAKAKADAYAAKVAAQAKAQYKAARDYAARLEAKAKAKVIRDAQTKAKTEAYNRGRSTAEANAAAERIAQAAKTADGEAVYRAKMRRELAQEKSTTQDALNAYRLLEAEHQQATNELAQVDKRIIQAALAQKKLQNGESPLKEYSKLQRRTLNTIGLGDIGNKQSFGLAAITIALGITAILGRVD